MKTLVQTLKHLVLFMLFISEENLLVAKCNHLRHMYLIFCHQGQSDKELVRTWERNRPRYPGARSPNGFLKYIWIKPHPKTR
jgi:hypothetical protein